LENLLTIFVGLTALAIMAQAGVLIAIYVKSQQLAKQQERFMAEARELMVPVRSIAENLRTASANLVEIGMSARDQFRRVEAMVTDTGEALHVQLERFDRVSQNVVDRINETAEIVQDSVVKPAREVAAVAKGLSRGFGAFFFRNRSTVDQARPDEELFI
jgi:methylthioribose-1-phosphate isomerase